MRKRVVGSGIVLLVVGLVSASVWAGHGRFHNSEHFGERILDKIEDALEDDAPLSDGQEKAIQDLIKRTQAQMHNKHQDRAAHMDKALTLFTQDEVDAKAVEGLKQEHQAAARQMSDTVSRALIELHDILTPQQRQLLANHMRERAKHWRGH